MNDGTQRVLAFVPDLMDRSRLSALPDVDLTFVADVSELATRSAGWPADVVVLDLSRPGVLDALAAGGLTGRIIGFGSHIDSDSLDAARAAGCHEVLPRSRFFARTAEILAG